jgi:hypothetical protein
MDVNSFSTTTLLSIVTAPSVSTSGGDLTFNADEEGNYRVGGRLVYRVPGVHERDSGGDRCAKASRANRGGAPAEQLRRRAEGGQAAVHLCDPAGVPAAVPGRARGL